MTNDRKGGQGILQYLAQEIAAVRAAQHRRIRLARREYAQKLVYNLPDILRRQVQMAAVLSVFNCRFNLFFEFVIDEVDRQVLAR